MPRNRELRINRTQGKALLGHFLVLAALGGVLPALGALGQSVHKAIAAERPGQAYIAPRDGTPFVASHGLAGVSSFARQAASAAESALDLQKVGRFVQSAQARAGDRARLAKKFSDGRARSRMFSEHAREVTRAFGADWAMRFLEQKTRLSRSDDLRARIDIADVDGPSSQLWDDVAAQLKNSEAPDKPELAARAAQLTENHNVRRIAFEVTQSQSIDELINRYGVAEAEPRASPDSDLLDLPNLSTFSDGLEAQILTDADLYFFGQLFAEQDAYFKRIDNLSQQRAFLSGARALSQIYHDDARRAVLKSLTRSLRNHDEVDFFASPKGHGVLEDMVTQILRLDESGGALGALYEVFRRHPDDEVGRHILDALVDARNQRAVDLALDRLFGESAAGQDLAYRQHLLELLTRKRHVDGRLPKAIDELVEDGGDVAVVYNVLQVIRREFGVLPDKETLNWAWDVLSNQDARLLAPETDIDDIQRVVRRLVDARRPELEALHALDSADRLEALLNSDLALLYFIFYGKRSQYDYYQRFDYRNFIDALKAHAEAEAHVDPSLFRADAVPNEDWHAALLARRRPSDDLVWTLRLAEDADGSPAELANGFAQAGQTLRALTAQALGQTELSPKHEGKLHKLLGDELSAALLDEGTSLDLDAVSTLDFSGFQKKLLYRLRQLRKQSKDAEEKAQWKELVRLAEEDGPLLSLRYAPAVLTGDAAWGIAANDRARAFGDLLHDLDAHLASVSDVSEDVRQVTLRYLDGSQDFIESLRFTDGARCCIVTGGSKDRSGLLKAKMSRDPHWFVLQVEDSAPDAAKRQVGGFVFGSYAFVDGEPSLVLNGVYMHSAEQQARIVDSIYERVGRPAGIKRIAMAAINGGRWDPDPSLWRRAEEQTLYRPRAMVDADGKPDTKMYDDIGTVVNEQQELKRSAWIRDYE